MKLFVWDGDGVLENYRSGYVLVLAKSIERAREMVMESMRKSREDLYSLPWDKDDEEQFRDSIAFLHRQPSAYTEEVCFLIEGSE